MEPHELTSASATRIRALLKRMGLTQKQLADLTGLKESDVSRLLSPGSTAKERVTSLATLSKIAEALDVTVAMLLPGGDPQLPLAGPVSCGPPSDGDQTVMMIDVPKEAYGAGRYVLLAEGDSMVDFHITPGTYVVIMPCDSADDQQDVLVQMDGGFTLKRLMIRGKGKKQEVLLMGSDGAQPIRLRDGADAKIIGVVKYSFRRHK